MNTKIKNTIRFILLSLKYNMKSVAEYKKSFLIQSIFMIFNNFFFLIYWVVVFSLNNGDLNGIQFKDVLLLWSIPNGAWGIANFLFGGLRDIDNLIITGGLDTYLLQPKNIIISIALSKARFSSFGDLVYGVIMGILVAESFLEFFGIIFFMIIGSIIMMSCYIIVRSLAVWLGNMENIASVYENSLLITLSTYPFTIFGNFMKAIMFTIVPTAYITHIPIRILTVFDIKLLIVVIAFSIFILLFAILFFKNILKKYESGNNIAMKD